MAWNDDSWKDGYDAWKLASPDDDYEEDPCDHDDYETDLLDGRCRCICGHSWYASTEDIDRQLRFQSEYAEAMEREDSRQWWSDLLWAVRHPIATAHWEMQKRGWFRKPAPSDDDIPF
jgi:hypothetical protein